MSGGRENLGQGLFAAARGVNIVVVNPENESDVMELNDDPDDD